MTENLSLDQFIHIRAKPFQPRPLKFPCFKQTQMQSQPPNTHSASPIAHFPSKNRSSSLHNDSQTLKLPSIQKNNLKYFLKEASVKELKRKNYQNEILCLKNPGFFL